VPTFGTNWGGKSTWNDDPRRKVPALEGNEGVKGWNHESPQEGNEAQEDLKESLVNINVKGAGILGRISAVLVGGEKKGIVAKQGGTKGSWPKKGNIDTIPDAATRRWLNALWGENASDRWEEKDGLGA